MRPMKLAEFEKFYRNRQEAADALGVTRQSFYDWQRKHNGAIPDPWCWKAKSLVEAISGGQKGNGRETEQ